MINENRIGLTENPWGVLAPAILIAMLTVGLNTFTDAVARVSLGVAGTAEELRKPSWRGGQPDGLPIRTSGDAALEMPDSQASPADPGRRLVVEDLRSS